MPRGRGPADETADRGSTRDPGQREATNSAPPSTAPTTAPAASVRHGRAWWFLLAEDASAPGSDASRHAGSGHEHRHGSAGYARGNGCLPHRRAQHHVAVRRPDRLLRRKPPPSPTSRSWSSRTRATTAAGGCWTSSPRRPTTCSTPAHEQPLAAAVGPGLLRHGDDVRGDAASTTWTASTCSRSAPARGRRTCSSSPAP